MWQEKEKSGEIDNCQDTVKTRYDFREVRDRFGRPLLLSCKGSFENVNGIQQVSGCSGDLT